MTDNEKAARDELRRLWAIEAGRRPGPKPASSARDIARAGIELADRDGLAALSMRNVAKRLSTSAMSLYSQVPGKAQLIEVMIDEVAAECLDGPSGDWAARMQAVAWTNWRCFERHPWLLTLDSYRPVLGPNLLRKYDLELSAFEGLGLSDVEMDWALGSLLALTRGCALAFADANAAKQRSGISDEEWWAARAPLLAQLALPERFPLASRVGTAAGEHAKAPQAPEEMFRFALDIWIAGIASRLPRAQGG